jgi:hypothetical protein
VAGQGQDLVRLGPFPRVPAGPGGGQGALGRVQGGLEDTAQERRSARGALEAEDEAGGGQ